MNTVRPSNLLRAIPTGAILSPSKFRGLDYEVFWLTVPLFDKEPLADQSWRFREQLGFTEDLLCLHRWKVWWMIPKLTTEAAIPAETLLLLGRLKGGDYFTIIPAIDQGMGFSLEGAHSVGCDADERSLGFVLHGHDNSADSRAFSGETRKAAAIGVGATPYRVVKAAMSAIRNHLQLSGAAEFRNSCDMMLSSKGPFFSDYLGWCTWDSFYTDLSLDNVRKGLESFKRTGVEPRFLILDDGWQQTTVAECPNTFQWGGRLTSFAANFKFSNSSLSDHGSASVTELASVDTVNTGDIEHGLKEVVVMSKSTYRIKKFLVWHTLSGYWTGVEVAPANAIASSSFSISSEYSSKQTYPIVSASMRRISWAGALASEPFITGGVGLVRKDKVGDFFAAYHRELRKAGVDGVKVDAQSVVPTLSDNRTPDGGGWALSLAFHKALKDSVAANFNDDPENVQFPLIHCMCHSQGTLFAIAAMYPDPNLQPCSGGIPIVRGSDDFWPSDAASHGPHLFCNALNALLITEIGVHDWDMFQSELGAASLLHAAARAVSGGPVYLSDPPHKHDAALLRRLVFPDSGRVPRCLRGARLPERMLFCDPQRHAGVPLLLQNVNPASALVIAAFNIAGSVIENDLDMFRFLAPSEMKWRSNEAIAAALLSESSESTTSFSGHWEEGAEKSNRPREAKPRRTPVYEDPIFVADLQIDCCVGPIDVEEVMDGKDGGMTSYIAYRMTDHALFFVPGISAAVPLSLPRVFDVEIVSFAPVLHVHPPVLEGFSDKWVAVVGAVERLNPGGAVLSATLSPVINHTQRRERLTRLHMRVMGNGTYLIVSSLPLAENQTIPSAISHSGTSVTGCVGAITIKAVEILVVGKKDEQEGFKQQSDYIERQGDKKMNASVIMVNVSGIDIDENDAGLLVFLDFSS